MQLTFENLKGMQDYLNNFIFDLFVNNQFEFTREEPQVGERDRGTIHVNGVRFVELVAFEDRMDWRFDKKINPSPDQVKRVEAHLKSFA
jgi:hypothetical protein